MSSTSESASNIPDAVYDQFFGLWIHKDKLLWKRVTLAAIVQLATVAAAFAIPLHKPSFALLIVIFGTVVLGIFVALVRQDLYEQQYVRLTVLDKYHVQERLEPPAFRMLPEPTGYLDSSSNLLGLLAKAALTLNAGILIWFVQRTIPL